MGETPVPDDKQQPEIEAKWNDKSKEELNLGDKGKHVYLREQ